MFYQVIAIYQFNPDPDPHFQFLCEHGACLQDTQGFSVSCHSKQASLHFQKSDILKVHVDVSRGESKLCCVLTPLRAPDKVRIFISKTSISAPNPIFDHLLESSHRDDSNKWSNIGFGREIKELASIEIHFTHLIWHPDLLSFACR